jgi:2,4-dienoyl-CoA reductase (NADPH2)
VDTSGLSAGSLLEIAPRRAQREVHMLQRSAGRPAARLGISTGWIVRTTLKRRGVTITTGCAYERIDDAGLHYVNEGEKRLLEVDNVVICAGQESAGALAAELQAAGVPFDLIGGARHAAELDAQRAIDDGYRLGLAC